ncbi:MAG TPA: hypothetical protein VEJ36_00520 [Nitrososphaerales archaeon]|nr:hypothetical protein [Nitrososphaerales archaeon]
MFSKRFNVKIERASDLIYWTYFMVDWGKAKQTPSEEKCTRCGGSMSLVEPVTDQKGISYDGLVCHECKQLLWVRRD